MAGLKQFCFAPGEATREEVCAARSGATGKRADTAGVRRTETLPACLPKANRSQKRLGGRTLPHAVGMRDDRWAGHVWPNTRGLRLGRI